MTDDEMTSVRVAVRVRPLVSAELIHNPHKCVWIDPSEPTQMRVGKNLSFTFDVVLDESSNQNDVYESCVSNLVDKFTEGYNATILAYGQTVCFILFCLTANLLLGFRKNVYYGY